MSTYEILRAEFERGGPIRFDRFMDVCLYGSEGFFTSSPDRAGLRGDFVTSVELGPVFAGVLARRILVGCSTPLRVADVGGGRGTLAAQLEAAGDGAIEAVTVDRMAVMGPRGVADLPRSPDVIVAHELLDNLPARLVYRGDTELRVGFGDDGGPCLYHVPLDEELATFCEGWLPGVAPGVAPVPVGALAWIAEVAALGVPRVVMVDYGADVAELASRDDWPVRGYVAQREVDPIAAPGDTDVTCDVAFDVVEAGLRRHGYETERLRQRDWLVRHGIDAVVAEASEPGGALGRLRAAEARSQSADLCDPSGLGAFWVLEASRPPD